MDSKALVEEFLNCSLTMADEVFCKFAALEGAVYQKGEKPLERFVYIPGTRNDRVVLVAHADTVWDNAYGNPQTAQLIFEDGVFRSGKVECGIGADDRAGCAMVWAMRNSGHSLLIVDGEEKGKHGAKFLRDAYPRIYKELNRHSYMIEFDWAGTGGCLFNQVDNTPQFKEYIAREAGFVDSKHKGGCDLQILCHKICGVNLSVGWQGCHRSNETLALDHWEKTYETMQAFLQRPQNRFAIPASTHIKKFLVRVRNKLASIVRKFLPKKSK